MNLSEYRTCLGIARSNARTDADAADLLHEALLVAVRESRMNFSEAGDRSWLRGVMRNLAAQRIRTETRRRHRESSWVAEQEPGEAEAGAAPEPAAILAGLSRGTRRVAVLALHGLNPDEICYILELKPAAFRQRLTALRRMLGRLPAPLRKEAMALACVRPHREGEHHLHFGLIRRALMHHVGMGSDLGTHDPDGHLLGLRTK